LSSSIPFAHSLGGNLLKASKPFIVKAHSFYGDEGTD
jgi:hypothetical protein